MLINLLPTTNGRVKHFGPNVRPGFAPAHYVDLPVDDGGGGFYARDARVGALSPAVEAAVEHPHLRGPCGVAVAADDIDVVP